MTKEFKIDNSKSIKKEIYFISFLITINILGLVVLYLLQIMYEFSFSFIMFFLICFLVYLLYRVINLRRIHVESSGIILTIKSYHPVRKGIIGPILELPIDHITQMRIEKKSFYTILILTIKTQNKTFQKKIDITGIGRQKLRVLSL